MSASPFSRRQFLGTAAVATVVGVPRAVPRSAALHVRKSLTGMAANAPELKALAAAVQKMTEWTSKAKDKLDPLGWDGQADIHVRDCPHGNWFFLPWHRAYLLFFERLCRHYSDKDFTLPYWDWTKNPKVPDAFLDPKSPLYHAKRAAKLADLTARPGQVGQRAIDKVLGEAEFRFFAGIETDTPKGRGRPGSLESGPHNYIHNFVSGFPLEAGVMSVPQAPLDPLFWVHHANVDRLWNRWLKDHPTGMPDHDSWLKTPLAFKNVAGKDESLTVRECLTTHALGYRYDTDDEKPPMYQLAKQPISPKATARVKRTEQGDDAWGRSAGFPPAVTVAVPLTDAVRPQVVLVVKDAEKPVAVAIEFEMDVAKWPGGEIRVFVGPVPDKLDSRVGQEPEADPGFVGVVSPLFVGSGGRHGGHDTIPGRAGFVLNLSPALRSLWKERKYLPQADLPVQFLLAEASPDALPGRGVAVHEVAVSAYCTAAAVKC